VAPEPGPGQFDDPRLADALRAGDVIALTEVYDTYAPFLFDYCHGLLRDRVEAAGALRNTLIAARAHIAGLGDPARLRGWLYALARKESMRRRDEPSRHTGQEAPEAEDGDLSAEQLARRTERRLLAHSAMAALSGRQREAIDLAVRHELEAADIAAIFGTSYEEVTALLEAADADLEAALRAALIAQNHWEDCPSVSALTGSWPLTPKAAQSLVRHVSSCPTCEPRDTPRIPADRLLAVLPIAAIPADLRLDVLTAATAPDRTEFRRGIAAMAEPFDEYGWPLPYRPGAAREREASRRNVPLLAAVGGGIVAVALIIASMTAFAGGNSGANSAAPPSSGQSGHSTDPADGSDPLPPPSSSGPPSPSQTPSPTTSSPSPSPSASPSKSPSPTPSVTGRPGNPPRTRKPAPPPPRPGTLTVSGCSMGVEHSCSVHITAVGGAVNWQVAGASGDLSAGGAGHLEPGQTVGVTVSRTNGWCWGSKSGTVSFAPGGAAQVSYC
jgi:RNA polymerase sigma factor (sigma-70 family)